jgi:hypothetical protein
MLSLNLANSQNSSSIFDGRPRSSGRYTGTHVISREGKYCLLDEKVRIFVVPSITESESFFPVCALPIDPASLQPCVS